MRFKNTARNRVFPPLGIVCIPCSPAGRDPYLCWEAKEKRPLPRSDTSSVHDCGRVKPVFKTSSETGLEKQIVRMLRAELGCNDIEPVVSKWRLAQRGHFEVFMLFEVF